MKKILIAATLICITLTSCNDRIERYDYVYCKDGNVKNGGYVIPYKDYYLFNDGCKLFYTNFKEKNELVSYNHHNHCEMSLCDCYIYYLSSSPGNIWRMSVSGNEEKKLVDKLASNLILTNTDMYYILSEDDDWGKLYKANLHGKEEVILANMVENFSLYDDTIYYNNIEDNHSLWSMRTDGTLKKKINDSYALFGS